MYLPALPKIADELSVSSSVAQLTLTGTLAGLALGQLIVGPLSDSLGRRRPLMAGIVLHMLASVLCLFAPNIAVLGVARGLQGMGAAAAMVVAIAVVGDLFADSVAATVMSRLMLVLGVAPVVAPSLGAAVLLTASWHWVFAVLVVLAGGAACCWPRVALPETLPVSHRRPLQVRGIAGHLCRAAARRRGSSSWSSSPRSACPACSPTSRVRRSCCRAATGWTSRPSRWCSAQERWR